MKVLRGIKIGGLQSKIFSLMLILAALLLGLYALIFGIHQQNLSQIARQTGDAQQAAITETSEATIEKVMNTSMTRITALQAYVADDLFSEVRANVSILRSVAYEIFENAEAFPPHAFYPPNAENAGTPSVQMQHEKGVDPMASKDLGLVANMSEIMLAVFESCDKLDSCFVATTDGCILYVDDRADVYINADGTVADATELSARPWYRQAVEAGELIFTSVEADTFTGTPGLVCAAPVYCDGALVAVVGGDIFLTSINDYVQHTASEGGFLCVVGDNGQVLFSPREEGVFKPALSRDAQDLRQIGSRELTSFINRALRERTGITELRIDDRDWYLSGAPMPSVGWAVISVVDKVFAHRTTAAMLQRYDEINNDAARVYMEGSRRSMHWAALFSALVVLLALFSGRRLGRRIVRPLEQLTRRINAQQSGELLFTADESTRTGDEIEILADAFAAMTRRTQDYIQEIIAITAEKKRIGTELELASRIQADMLPSDFPAFPDRTEFDLYATMDPAKEVGGDFYDFFLIDENRLGLVMADVSGKGVPGALLMMIAKLLVQNTAMAGHSPGETLCAVNNQICMNNREEMFVTVWFGILDLTTGKIIAANAGHEYPAVMEAGGQFALLKDRHGFVIGGMENMRYKEYELQLSPGSRLFLYTDGVPEATNENNELFGTERMLGALNTAPNAAPETILKNVRAAVDDFVQDAEQFDDMTMLCLEYRGKGSGKMGL